jgi:hypothetical protein
MTDTPTPWGPADHEQVLASGITLYSTAGHGGIAVTGEVARKMPAALRGVGQRYGGKLWFEEDAAWAAVYLAFPEELDEQLAGGGSRVGFARETFERWYPAENEKFRRATA